MTRKSFSGNASPTTLSANMGSGDTTFQVTAITNWPNTTTGPFVVTVDRGTGFEEKILCSSYTGTTVTVASGGRGYDDTTAQSHTVPATVNCTLDATTIDSHDAFVNGVGTVTPSTSAVGDTAADGTSTKPAAADHKHARESFAEGVTSSSSPGDTAADGTSSSPARADHKHAREAAATDSGWTAVAGGVGYQNGYSAGASAPYFRLQGNRVTIRGSVQGGTGGAACFTLPTGYRPQTQMLFACPTTTGTQSITVTTGGAVEPASGTPTSYLDSVTFQVD